MAQVRDRLVRTELERVRASASSWRNGLAGLLAALAGFSLIRGRTDVGQLAQAWAVIVGSLLLGAFASGLYGALAVLRAAHGRPSVVPVSRIRHEALADHAEALESAAALRIGIFATLSCVVLLVSAVGITWYGPARAVPSVLVTTSSASWCGTVTEVTGSQLKVRDRQATTVLDFSEVKAVRAVDSCP